nr:YbaB/EbfC family nucleoid-associated protein [Nocardia bovistercoris]
MDQVQEQFRTIARIQGVRAELTGTASVLKGRVRMTVDANGTVVETKFGPSIEDLSYAEIAKAVTDAAQRAAADLAERQSELMRPLDEQRARLPKLSDLIEGMPDLALPNAPKPGPVTAGDGERPGFENVEIVSDTPTRKATDTVW